MLRPETSSDALQAYLLGSVDFASAMLLQRRLHYDVTGNRDRAALVLCEHPARITVGRHGSHGHLKLDLRGWDIQWVSRGGGCWLHVPGQVNVYSILPLDRLGLSIPEYLRRLGDVFLKVLDDFSVQKNARLSDAGVCVADRPVATIGVSVRDGVATFGACLNLCPDLELFRGIRSHPAALEPMTSLERERHGPVRPALVRERLVERFAETFGFSRVVPFSDHPLLHRRHDVRQPASA